MYLTWPLLDNMDFYLKINWQWSLDFFSVVSSTPTPNKRIYIYSQTHNLLKKKKKTKPLNRENPKYLLEGILNYQTKIHIFLKGSKSRRSTDRSIRTRIVGEKLPERWWFFRYQAVHRRAYGDTVQPTIKWKINTVLRREITNAAIIKKRCQWYVH